MVYFSEKPVQISGMQKSSFQTFQIPHHRLAQLERYRVHKVHFSSIKLGGLYRAVLSSDFQVNTCMKLESYLFLSRHKVTHTSTLYHPLPYFGASEYRAV